MLCRRCSKKKAARNGFCVACHPGCSNCKSPDVVSKGRCSACYQYFRSHGRERGAARHVAKTQCSNCGSAPAISRGRCSACYQYYRNHGGDIRGARLRARLARGSPKRCSNCGASDVSARGRCRSCYGYLRRTGRDRRPGTKRTQKARSCSACGRDGVKSRGRCASCYQYYNKHGRDRSKERIRMLRDRSERPPCSNCKKKPAASKGRCAACYQYYRNHGTERDPSGRTPKSERRKKESCINGCAAEPVLWAEKLWQEPYYGARPEITTTIKGRAVPVGSGWLCEAHHYRWKLFPCLRRPPPDGKGPKIRAYPRGPWICKGRRFSDPGSCHGAPLKLERVDGTGEIDYGGVAAGSMNAYLDGMCPRCRFAEQQAILDVASRPDGHYPEPHEMDEALDMMLAGVKNGAHDPPKTKAPPGAKSVPEVDPMTGDPVGWSPKLEDLV